jgi:hypothetical protein
MSELYLHNKPIESLFQLLGEDENDITYTIGWALHRSKAFLGLFLKETLGAHVDSSQAGIYLQHHQHKKGITDIEIKVSGQFHLIAEAKKGWTLPKKKQLKKYASRMKKDIGPDRRIVVLSECGSIYAKHHLEARHVNGIPVTSVSWRKIVRIAKSAIKTGKNAEKRLLRELITYLGRVMSVQDLESNWALVVVLNSGTKKGWGISWIDIVKKRKRYFHRMGEHGWPKEPPNYVAFRYRGKLRSIHHVEDYEVTTDLHKYIPEIPSKKGGPDFIYKLGPAIIPAREVRNGKIYANARLKAMLDTLLTCRTIEEAVKVSQKRKRRIEGKDS